VARIESLYPSQHNPKPELALVITSNIINHNHHALQVPDMTYDFIAQNQNIFRALPLWAGGLGIAGLLGNRLISGVSQCLRECWDCCPGSMQRDSFNHSPFTCALSQIAPVVDASSSQSRTDVLGIIMSAVLLLTGLQWLSLKPRTIPAVSAWPLVGNTSSS
jgi:hypothetical protein